MHYLPYWTKALENAKNQAYTWEPQHISCRKELELRFTFVLSVKHSSSWTVPGRKYSMLPYNARLTPELVTPQDCDGFVQYSGYNVHSLATHVSILVYFNHDHISIQSWSHFNITISETFNQNYAVLDKLCPWHKCIKQLSNHSSAFSRHWELHLSQRHTLLWKGF